MAGVAGTLSNTISRFKFLFPHPSSLHFKLSKFSILKQKIPAFRLNSPNYCTQLSHFSSKSTTTQFNSHKTQFETMENANDLVILGIETSCDDTGAAVVRGNGEILSQVVSSQLYCLASKGVTVAWTGIEHFCVGKFDPPPPVQEAEDIVYDLRPRWPLGEEYAEGRIAARSMKTARVHPSLTSLIQGSAQQPLL